MAAGLALLARRGGELFEGDGVDPDRVLGAEQDQFFAQLQVAAAVQPDRVERAPGREDRLMQVVAGGVRVPPRPQQLGGLLDVRRRSDSRASSLIRKTTPKGSTGTMIWILPLPASLSRGGTRSGGDVLDHSRELLGR